MPPAFTRRDLLKATTLAAAVTPVTQAAAPAARAVIEPFHYRNVRLLDGPAKRQFDSARDFFLHLPDDNLLKGFRQRRGLPAPGQDLIGWYGGDPAHPAWWSKGDTFNAFGQYLSGMARLGRAAGDSALLDKAAGLMREWARAIDPDGYFYYSRHPFTPHYIYEKTMCGLVDLYEYGGLKDALPLMERITAWAVKNLDRSRKNPGQGADFSANGQEWYTLPENLYRAWHLTGDARYRDFAALWHYPAYWDMFISDREPTPFGLHAYSHVNTLSSAAMTYAATADPRYLKTIVNAYDWFERTQFYATGGFGPNERLLPPDGSLGRSLDAAENTFETVCGSWACFKLSRYLMTFTGDARYGDWIEKLFYNGIGAALPLAPDGNNFYYSDYRVGGGRKIYNRDWRWSCCSGTWPQAIADYANIIWFHDPEALYVNLYVPSEVTWSKGEDSIRVTQETRYPEEATSLLRVDVARPVNFALKFRVPGWSQGLRIEINGELFSTPARPRTWAAVERMWRAGDRVKIEIPMEPSFAPIDRQHPNRVALTCGPVVLVRRESQLSASIPHKGSGLEFHAAQPEATFVPFSRIGQNESYCMYFDRQV